MYIDDIIWLDQIVEKLAWKHRISPEEVEEVFYNGPRIRRGPKGAQPLYAVVPEPKEPLTDAEKTMVKEFLERMDLTKLSAPESPDEIRAKLGLVNVGSSSSDFGDLDGSSQSDDDDFNFDD